MTSSLSSHAFTDAAAAGASASIRERATPSTNRRNPPSRTVVETATRHASALSWRDRDAGLDVGRARLRGQADPCRAHQLGDGPGRDRPLPADVGDDPDPAADGRRRRRFEPGLDDGRLPAGQVVDTKEPVEHLVGRALDLDLALDADQGAGAEAGALAPETVTRTIPGGTPATASDPDFGVMTSMKTR